MFLCCQWSMESSYMAGDHSFPWHGWSREMWHSTSTLLLNFHTLLTVISSGANTALMLSTLGCAGLFTCVFELVMGCMILCFEIQSFQRWFHLQHWAHIEYFIDLFHSFKWSTQILLLVLRMITSVNVCYWTWVKNKMVKSIECDLQLLL